MRSVAKIPAWQYMDIDVLVILFPILLFLGRVSVLLLSIYKQLPKNIVSTLELLSLFICFK